MLRIIALFVFLFFGFVQSLAQTLIVSGKIINIDTKDELPFANVTTIKSKLGTATDGEGVFRLKIREKDISDSIMVSFIGFESYKAPIKSLKKTNNIIELIPSSETLNEFVLSPLTANEFMKEVVIEIPNNRTQKPFSAISYYSDKAKENEGYLGQNEAVVKSYFPNFSDTSVDNQHQIVLYDERKDLSKLQFMAKRLRKEEDKYKDDLKEKGDDSTEVNFMDPRTMFGGLDNVMEAMHLDSSDVFLDTNQFKKYEFKFHNKPLYSENGDEITLIHAKTKRRVEGFKAEGKIYVDRKSLAIIKMEFKGDLKIPILLKPILFVMGIGIKNPKLHYARTYQKIDGSWYPNEIYYTIKLNLIQKRLFKKNINSMFNLQQVFSMQNIVIDQPEEIEVDKRYTEEKPLAEQVFEHSSINWSNIKKVQF